MLGLAFVFAILISNHYDMGPVQSFLTLVACVPLGWLAYVLIAFAYIGVTEGFRTPRQSQNRLKNKVKPSE